MAPKTKALFIGINYPGQQGELRGCVNDVKMMMRVLGHCAFPLNDIRVLVDTNDIPERHGLPTNDNIMDGLQWLVEDAQSGDTLFLHYSGHGTQVRDTMCDEADGMDEALVPCDYQSAGLITDDELMDTIIAPLPEGVRLTALLDCCHSGTLLDLPFTWEATEQNTSRALGSGAAQMHLQEQWTDPSFVNDILGEVDDGCGDAALEGFKPTGGAKAMPADVIMFSGCRDEQTSADVSNTSGFGIPSDVGPGGAGGACTSALTEALMANPTIPFVELLEKMRVNLAQRKFTQVPQLSSSKPVDLGRPFSLFGELTTAPAQVVPPSKKNNLKVERLKKRRGHGRKHGRRHGEDGECRRGRRGGRDRHRGRDGEDDSHQDSGRRGHGHGGGHGHGHGGGHGHGHGGGRGRGH